MGMQILPQVPAYLWWKATADLAGEWCQEGLILKTEYSLELDEPRQVKARGAEGLSPLKNVLWVRQGKASTSLRITCLVSLVGIRTGV